MKSLLRKCVSFGNLSFTRINTVRLASSKNDAKKKEEAKDVEDIKIKKSK